jgi:membrane protein DedA with SNARE-associated domain
MFEWVRAFLESSGYLGIALLMFVENAFPPIPSELIMPLAGFLAAQGKLDLFGVVLAGSFGSVLGALLWYLVGRWLGGERLRTFAAKHGRWLTISPSDVDDARCWFARHGRRAVLFGRVIPGVRTLISVPAGIAEMSLAPFLIFSAIGTAIWSGSLAAAGYSLEQHYNRVAEDVGPVFNVIIAALGVAYLWRGMTWSERPK